MRLNIPVIFEKRLFLFLFFGFIIATVIGTVSHEAGHYLAGKILGFKGLRISYKYTFIDSTMPTMSKLEQLYKRYPAGIKNNQPFPEKNLFDSLVKKDQREILWFDIGGPLETMLVGTIGFLLLIVFRKRYFQQEVLAFWQWVLIFLSLFWLRQVFNFVCTIALFATGRIRYIADEFRIAAYLHCNRWSVTTVTAAIGVVILGIVAFKFVPAKERLTFLAAGLAGGIAGAVLWLVVLGPVFMP
jgi:hypothetical protein